LRKIQLLRIKGLALFSLNYSEEALRVYKSLSTESNDDLYNFVLMLWSKGEKVRAASEWMGHRSIPWNETPQYYQRLVSEKQ
jgi:hypothetical protein